MPCGTARRLEMALTEKNVQTEPTGKWAYLLPCSVWLSPRREMGVHGRAPSRCCTWLVAVWHCSNASLAPSGTVNQ